MVITNQEAFFKLTQYFDIVPYTQSRGMFEFNSLYRVNKIKFFVNDLEKPSIACFGNEKSFGIWKMISIEGECLFNAENISINDIRSFYKEITLTGYDFIEVCSNSKYDFGYETALRQAGYLRPVGQFSMPITKIIDLTVEIKYNQNWKRNLKKTTNNSLIFESIENPKLSDCKDFITIYEEMSTRKSLTSSFSKEHIFELCKTENFRLFFVSTKNKRIAGIIIHLRKMKAGLLYAATNGFALEVSASFFMYDKLFHQLRSIGIKSFDFEKLVPSLLPVNNVFLFKNGVKGDISVLNGEWSWYKKTYHRPLMYFVKKYLMKKREL